MLEKRKRRVKFIMLIVLCVALAGISVVEGMLYMRTRKTCSDLQTEKDKLQQDYEDISTKLEDKDTEITEIKQEVEELNNQLQDAQKVQAVQQSAEQAGPQENTDQEGMLSPSSGESAFSDTQLVVGQPISDDEIINIGKYFTSSPIERGGEIFNRINGRSYRDNDDISLESLRYLTIPYYNFDKQVMLGEMIVNVDIENDVLNIFRELFDRQYEIKSMKLIDDYWQEGYSGSVADNNSIEDNNTSCFCYRPVTGGENISNHGYGRAIDINPQQNPYVYNGENTHRNADQYMDRSCGDPHVIVASENDVCYSVFTKYGFSWGGNWENPIDYQHFEKPAV